MKLTKYEHACVVLEQDGGSVVIDPGSFSADAAGIIAGADAVLLTHSHFDHVNQAAISEALTDRPELRVYGPAELTETFSAYPEQFAAVAAGDELRLGPVSVSVHGTEHKQIHPDIPVIANVGYLVNDTLYHPGDAFFVPPAAVSVLLVPTSGPWMRLGEAADYVRAVRPQQIVQIHEMLLSDIGLGLTGNLLGESGLTGLPLAQLPPGDSVSF